MARTGLLDRLDRAYIEPLCYTTRLRQDLHPAAHSHLDFRREAGKLSDRDRTSCPLGIHDRGYTLWRAWEQART